MWRLPDRIGCRDLPADDLGKTRRPLLPEVPVDSPAPQIAVDEEDTLSRRREHVTEVHGEKGLSDAGAGAREADHVVGRIHERELQCGAKAPQALDGEVVWVVRGENGPSRAGPVPLPRELGLLRAVRHAGVDGESRLPFDLGRILDALMQRFTGKGGADAAGQPE